MTVSRRPANTIDVVPAFLAAPEAAIFLGVSESTLKKWRMGIPQGPPFCKLPSGLIRYPLADLKAWALSFRIDPLVGAALVDETGQAPRAA